jgi:hypothetical protein
MLLVLLVAILASILLVRFHHLRQQRADSTEEASAGRPTAVVVVHTPTPTPQPERAPTPSVRVRVAEKIGSARLALQGGNVDEAISHVSAAALLDIDSSAVIETAEHIVQVLLGRAEAAAGSGNWEEASRSLDRAREMSIRFGFPVEVIDAAARRHERMAHFLLIDPHDVGAIRASTGKRAVVYIEGGSTQEGRIRGVSGRSLELDKSTQIGTGSRGGQVHFVEPIHLDLITEIRIYED